MKTLVSAALFAALFVAPLALAPAGAQGVAVAYADLDLANPADAATLDRRIAAAARAACGRPSAADLVAQNALDRCRAEARQRASLQRDRAMAEAKRTERVAVAAAR